MTADDDRFDRPVAGELMRDERSAAGCAEGQEHDTRALLARLGRPHASGGTVIERAALLAEGADFEVAMAWILAHGGMPEARAASSPVGGLYGARSDGGAAGGVQTPRRFPAARGAGGLIGGAGARGPGRPPATPAPR